MRRRLAAPRLLIVAVLVGNLLAVTGDASAAVVFEAPPTTVCTDREMGFRYRYSGSGWREFKTVVTRDGQRWTGTPWWMPVDDNWRWVTWYSGRKAGAIFKTRIYRRFPDGERYLIKTWRTRTRSC